MATKKDPFRLLLGDPLRNNETWIEICQEHHRRLNAEIARERERYEAYQARLDKRRADLDRRVAERLAGKA